MSLMSLLSLISVKLPRSLIFGGLARGLPGLLALLWVGGCQTLPTTPPALPVTLAPLFANCLPGDGASAMQLFSEQRLLGTAEVAWIAPANGDWQLEMTNAANQTLLSMRRHGIHLQTLARSPDLAARLPQFFIDADDNLEVNGHDSGLKGGEIPCLLAHSLPRAWLTSLSAVSGVAASIDDGRRHIEVVVAAAGDGVCANLSWRKWLVVPQHLQWCIQSGARAAAANHGGAGFGKNAGKSVGRASRLRYQDYSLRWVSLEEG